MAISQRFISNLALAIAGAVVVVSTQTFTASVAGWVTFGVSLGALALLAVVQLESARGLIQHALDAGIGALALWSAVASVVYNGTTLTWMSFAEGSAFVALALAGLVVHEIETERAVVALETVPNRDRAEELQAAA
jgi:heme exporter protein D